MLGEKWLRNIFANRLLIAMNTKLLKTSGGLLWLMLFLYLLARSRR